MRKTMTTVIIVAIFTMILYYISVAIVADALDDALAAGYSSGPIPGIDAAIFIIMSETAVLVLAFYIASVATYNEPRIAFIAACAIPMALLLNLVISIASLASYPGYEATSSNWWFSPVLFDVYVLRNPGAGLAIQGVVLIGSFIALLKINDVVI